MDCSIIDNKVVLRDGNAVSVSPNHFDDTEQIERYYGVVLKLIKMVNKLKYNGLKTIQSQLKTEHLQLETEIPQKPKKFILCIKPKDQSDDVQFEMQNLNL